MKKEGPKGTYSRTERKSISHLIFERSHSVGGSEGGRIIGHRTNKEGMTQKKPKSEQQSRQKKKNLKKVQDNSKNGHRDESQRKGDEQKIMIGKDIYSRESYLRLKCGQPQEGRIHVGSIYKRSPIMTEAEGRRNVTKRKG